MSGMGRREFVALLGGAAAAWPVAVRAQQAQRMRRIGVFMNYAEDAPQSQARLASFLEKMQDLGWTPSRNVQSSTAGASPMPTAIAEMRPSWSHSPRMSFSPPRPP